MCPIRSQKGTGCFFFTRFWTRRAIELGNPTIPEYIAQSHGSGAMGALPGALRFPGRRRGAKQAGGSL